MNQPKIELYVCDICGLCQKAKEFFRSRQLPFTTHEIFWDKAADTFVDSDLTREMYNRCGGKVDIVPQIFINGHHIPGWRKLEPMIASGEFDRLLQSK